jgi:hypothetical protein
MALKSPNTKKMYGTVGNSFVAVVEFGDKIKAKYGNNHQVTIALNQKPYSGSTAKLVQYLDQLDFQRGTNWRQLFPEVQEFFNA